MNKCLKITYFGWFILFMFFFGLFCTINNFVNITGSISDWLALFFFFVFIINYLFLIKNNFLIEE